MRITIVADVLGEENNGTTITIKRLINGLIEKGHDVVVVSPHEDEESINPKYYTVKKRSFGPLDKYVAKNGVELGKPDRKIITEAIKGSDIVHIELPFKMGKLAVKICKELNVPFTTAFHCQPENFSSHLGLKNFKPFNEYLYGYYNRTFFKNADFIHCPSEFIKSELERHNYKARKFAISNGVIPTYTKKETLKPENLKDKFVILFTGRFSKEKCHNVLIESMKYSKYADKIQLIFAGNGPLEEKIKKQGSKLINPPIMGFYTKEELSDIINYSDLYCHPSDIEIEAIGCIEALTCAKVPVICNSKRSATRFFALDERSLFKPNDPKDLAKKIDYWFEHPEEKQEMSLKYEEYAKQFRIENSINKMIDMFNEAIKLSKQKNTQKTKDKKLKTA